MRACVCVGVCLCVLGVDRTSSYVSTSDLGFFVCFCQMKMRSQTLDFLLNKKNKTKPLNAAVLIVSEKNNLLLVEWKSFSRKINIELI